MAREGMTKARNILRSRQKLILRIENSTECWRRAACPQRSTLARSMSSPGFCSKIPIPPPPTCSRAKRSMDWAGLPKPSRNLSLPSRPIRKHPTCTFGSDACIKRWETEKRPKLNSPWFSYYIRKRKTISPTRCRARRQHAVPKPRREVCGGQLALFDHVRERGCASSPFVGAMDICASAVRLRKMWRILLLASSCIFFLERPAVSQDRSTDESVPRGNRAEISVTLRDNSGQVITTPATVRIYRSGVLSGQAMASRGRAFFILNTLGDYTITVDASGYRPAQKEVSLRVAVEDAEDIYLKRDSVPENGSAVPGKPLLAPN